MNYQPLVSVIMPAFNVEKYIAFSITSIIRQDYKNWELIILNDGSTDQTVKEIKRFKDPRICLFHNETNLGLARTRNKLISLSRGKYIAILDSDDLAYPQRLSLQVTFLEQNADYGMIGSWIRFIDAEGNSLNKVMKYKAPSYKIPSILFIDNYFSQSSVTIRKELVNEHSYRLDFPPCEDYDLWIRIARQTKVYNLQQILTDYRIHEANISKVKANIRVQMEKRILRDQLDYVCLKYTEEQLDFFYNSLKYGRPLEYSLKQAISWIYQLMITIKAQKNPLLKELPSYIFMKFLKVIVKSVFCIFMIFPKR